MFSASNYNRHH